LKQKALSFFSIIFLAGAALCIGIRVSPGTILLQEAPIGETYDFMAREGLAITIGPVEKETSYLLSCEPASKGGSQATGYVDFPNPAWFYLANDSVTIFENETAEIPMWLQIPKNEGYYNHHWLLGIPISPTRTAEKGPQLQVGSYLLFRIETQAKKGVRPICAQNEIVGAPSRLVFLDVVPGSTIPDVIELYSGNEQAGIYSVYRLDPKSPVAELTIKGTPGFQRLDNPEWIQYPDTIVIPGKKEGSGVLPITVSLPQNPGTRRFEEILMIEGSAMRPAFVRILVIIKQE